MYMLLMNETNEDTVPWDKKMGQKKDLKFS